MTTIPDQNSFESEVVNHPGTVPVDFFTDSCQPCRTMLPILEEIARERTDLKIVKVDAVANPEIAGRFPIFGVPTFLLFNRGQIKGKFTGSRNKKDLLSWVEANR